MGDRLDLKNSPFVPASVNRERRLNEQIEKEKARKEKLESMAQKAEEKKKRKKAVELLNIQELDSDSKLSSQLTRKK